MFITKAYGKTQEELQQVFQVKGQILLTCSAERAVHICAKPDLCANDLATRQVTDLYNIASFRHIK